MVAQNRDEWRQLCATSPSLAAEPVQQQRFYCDMCNQCFRRAQDMARHRCDSIRSRHAAGIGIAEIIKGTSTTKFYVASVIDFICYFAERHHHGMAVFDQVKSSVCVCVCVCVCMLACMRGYVRAWVWVYILVYWLPLVIKHVHTYVYLLC